MWRFGDVHNHAVECSVVEINSTKSSLGSLVFAIQVNSIQEALLISLTLDHCSMHVQINSQEEAMKTVVWTATIRTVESPLLTLTISTLSVILLKSSTMWPINLFLAAKDGFQLTGTHNLTARGIDKFFPRSFNAHMISCKVLKFSSIQYWSTAPMVGTVHRSCVLLHNSCLTRTTEHSRVSKCWSKKTGVHSVTCLQSDADNSAKVIWKIGHKSSYSSLTASISSGTKWVVSLSSMINYSYSLLKRSTTSNMATSYLTVSTNDCKWKLVRKLWTFGQ